MAKLPEYSAKKMQGNIGEALVQYLLSNFSLVHKIDGSNDIGNDMICELIRETYPTNLLYYVQVKFWGKRATVSKETLEYWRTSPIPVYIFWVKNKKATRENVKDLSDYPIFYKCVTPIAHNKTTQQKEHFKKYDEITFKKDLIKDYARTQYKKGFVPIIEPRSFLKFDEKILMQLPEYAIFINEIIPDYSNEIIEKSWINPFITAHLLAKENKELLLARESIKVAQKLLQLSNDKNKHGFQWLIQTVRVIIEDKIAKFDLE